MLTPYQPWQANSNRRIFLKQSPALAFIEDDPKAPVKITNGLRCEVRLCVDEILHGDPPNPIQPCVTKFGYEVCVQIEVVTHPSRILQMAGNLLLVYLIMHGPSYSSFK
jgi:hypothetical protein